MNKIRTNIVVILVFLFACSPSLLFARSPNPKQPMSGRGIFQFIETHNGRKSCWGIIIQLGDLTFKKSIDQDELTITDAKYGKDMKPIMTWTVDKNRKRLTITFKQGMGDFGTGNDVTVTIQGHALVEEPEQDFVFRIATDVL